MSESMSVGSALTIADVRKRFGATQALDGVSLSIGLGEFVALLGPNGAGKSTLIKILDGVYRPDSGTVCVEAGAQRMSVVHQDLGLVPTMSIAENLFVGRRRLWRNPGKDAAQAAIALTRVGLGDVDPHTLVESLNLGRQALVAVAKALATGAQIVVVDELTAGLHPNESRWLVQQLRDAAHLGVTVLMVTHKLREVIGAADRYVVLVDGRIALDGLAPGVTLDDLVAVMSSGRVVSNHQPAVRAGSARSSGVICTLAGVCVGAAGPIELELRAGEITGLTGLVGSGLHDIAYVAAGRIRPSAGSVRMDGRVRRTCVPAHRETEGMFPDDSEGFNLAAGTWAKWRRFGFLRVRAMHRDCAELADRLSLVPRDLEAGVSSLSGGNQQKTLLGRALLDPPDLLVLCEPTRGVDVATRREIYSQIRRVAEVGTAILIASTDLDDLTSTAHRAASVGIDGAIGAWFSAADIPELALELI